MMNFITEIGNKVCKPKTFFNWVDVDLVELCF